MVIISRKDFLKLSMAFAGTLSLGTNMIHAATKGDDNPPLIWLQGSGCNGCSVSTLGVSDPATIDDVLLNVVNMKFHNTVMALAGQEAMASLDDAATQYNGQFILVIEGAIPTGENGAYCIIGTQNGVELTMKDAVAKYGPMAKYVVAAGTCAAFGGVSAASPNDGSVVSVKSFLTNTQNPVVNLPGCPVHPSVTIKALVALLTTGMPALDSENRPLAFYQSAVHDTCERFNRADCFKTTGNCCDGPDCYNVCSNFKWNGKYCMKTNYPCYGCANPNFPSNPLITYPDDTTWENIF